MKKLTKREKVLLEVSVVSVGVAGYIGYKYCSCKNDNSILEKKFKKAYDELSNITKENKNLSNRVQILEEVVSENVLDEAIATTTRKLNYIVSKIEAYKLRTDAESVAKLNEHVYFKKLFETRLKDFNKLKRLHYIEQ